MRNEMLLINNSAGEHLSQPSCFQIAGLPQVGYPGTTSMKGEVVLHRRVGLTRSGEREKKEERGEQTHRPPEKKQVVSCFETMTEETLKWTKKTF